MATLGIGANHDSEEVATLKRKLAQKDNECGTLHTQLLKKDAENDELRKNLAGITHKARLEADRVHQLDAELKSASEDLKSERIQRQNVELALNAANSKIKEHELDHRQLQSALDRLSSDASESTTAYQSEKRENAKLLARIQELEANMLHVSQTPAPRRRRSSSMPGARVVSLERQLADLREASQKCESDLSVANTELRRVQELLNQVENEKIALERHTERQLKEKDALLEDQADELEFLRARSNDNGARAREEELLRRVEMEESNAESLRLLLKEQDRELKKMHTAQQHIRDLEKKLGAEARKVAEVEARRTQLAKEKDDVLDELQAERVRLADAQSAMDRISSQKNALQLEVEQLLSKSQANKTPFSVRQASSDDQPIPVDDVQRLLIAVERLRAERDELRRSLDFVVAESRFNQEELAKQHRAASEIRDQRDQLGASLRQAQLTYQSSSAQGALRTKRAILAVNAFAVLLSRSQEQLDAAHASIANQGLNLDQQLARLRNSEAERDSLRAQVEQLQSELANSEPDLELQHALTEAESRLDDALQNLEATERQRVELNLEVYNLNSMLKESQNALDGAEAQLADLRKTLGDVESERGSLGLQVANLENDLEATKQELGEAEARYSTLQAQQLATMSTSQVSKALRDQLRELEERVLRRTEQIGQLQHDNKRLDTNLRLQEDRVGELTAEIETLTIERDAMVDDCAAAREARDEALRRVETLEMDVEQWELKATCAEENYTNQVASMTTTHAANTGELRENLGRLEEQLAEKAEALASTVELSTSLRLENEQLSTKLAEVQADYSRSSQLLAENDATLQSLREAAESDAHTHRQLVSAIAVAQLQQRTQARSLIGLNHARSSLIAKLEAVRQQQQQQESQLTSVREELGASTSLNANSSAVVDSLRTRLEEQEARYHNLEQMHVASEASHMDAVKALASDKDGLQLQVEEAHVRAQALERQLVTLQEESSAQIAHLQNRVDSVETELQTITEKKSELEARFANASSAWEDTRNELEAQIILLKEQAEAATSEIDGVRNQHTEALHLLEEKLSAQNEALSKARLEQDELEARYQQEVDALKATETTLNEKVSELLTQIQEHAKTEQDLTSIREVHAAELEDMQRRLKAASSELESLHEQAQLYDKERVSTQTLSHEVQALEERRRAAEVAQAELQSQLAIVEKRLAESTSVIHSLQQDKSGLQQNIAELQSTLHRLEETRQLLEIRSDETARTIQGLETDLEKTRALLADSQQQTRVAEATLQQMADDHEQSLTSLRAELNASKAHTNDTAPQTVQPNDYDDLVKRLRSVMVELEENDDRFIALNKEKKAYQAKINSLSRKVEKLQAKLEAATTATPKPPSTVIASAVVATPHVTSSSSSATLVSSSSHSITDLASKPSPDSPKSRSLITRSKSPEISMETASTIGKKRRVPEDFEDCNSVPPQAFTADSKPSQSEAAGTPRARHIGPRSGFTPSSTSRHDFGRYQQPARNQTSAVKARLAKQSSTKR